MKVIIYVIGLLLLAAPVYAEYTVAKVVQVDPPGPKGTVEITVEFSGVDEVAAKRTLLASPRHTKDMINEWASDTMDELNGTKQVKASVAVNEVLTTRVKP